MKKSKIPNPVLLKQPHNKFIEVTQPLTKFGDHFHLRLDFTYLDTKFECFSKWQQKQLKSLSTFIRAHRSQQNPRIDSSGDECSKLFRTYLSQYADRISEDLLDTIQAQHLYVGKKERIHGFKHKNIFYIIRLDCNHAVN